MKSETGLESSKNKTEAPARRWRHKKLVQTFGFEIRVKMRKLCPKVRFGLRKGPNWASKGEIGIEGPKNINKNIGTTMG